MEAALARIGGEIDLINSQFKESDILATSDSLRKHVEECSVNLIPEVCVVHSHREHLHSTIDCLPLSSD